MEKVLNQLLERLRKAHADRLVSVILYGSAAAGNHHSGYSDINVLCVLTEITSRELADSEPIFRWWREQGNPAPLLLSEHELRTCIDCFPIEFHDIKERRRVLHGQDLVAGVEINDSFYRAQVEHELRAKLLRLRQKAAGVLSDKQLLLRLMADSVSTFCVLFRHALLLAGHTAGFPKREIVAQAQAAFGIDPAPLSTLLDLREQKVKTREVDAMQLFEQYMRQIHVMVDAVDRLEK